MSCPVKKLIQTRGRSAKCGNERSEAVTAVLLRMKLYVPLE
jgi:hypothetical protein